MPLLGSFSLVLALALSVYCFAAGAIALFGHGPRYERLGETARRAGIAVWAAVVMAAAVLVFATFQNDFSIAYILHHSNRDLGAPYKFAALWSGQEGSLLFWSLLLASYGLVLRMRHKVDTRLVAYASVMIAAVQVFFLLLVNFAAPPFALTQGAIPAGRQRPESAAAVSRDGDPSADAVPGLRGLHRALRLRAGGADHALSRREVDPHHPPLDDGDVGISDLRNLSGRALGLRGAGLGRLLGMGPGGERVADAVADGHRVPALGDDAGKARHAEDVEHVADLRHLPAVDFRHLPDAQRRGQLGARLRAVVDRRLVRRASWR